MKITEHNHTSEITQKYVMNKLRLIIEDNLTNQYKTELNNINKSKIALLKNKRKTELEKMINWHDQTYRKLLKEENIKLQNIIDKELVKNYQNNNVIAICKNTPNKLSPTDRLISISFNNKGNKKSDDKESVHLCQFGYDQMIKFINIFKDNGYDLVDCSINYYNDSYMNVSENHNTVLDFINNNDVESILQYCIMKHCDILSITLKHTDGRMFTLYRDGYVFDDSLTGELCSDVFDVIEDFLMNER